METVSKRSVVVRLVRFGLVAVAAGAIGAAALFGPTTRVSASGGTSCNELGGPALSAEATGDQITHGITVYPCANVLPQFASTGEWITSQLWYRDVTNNGPWISSSWAPWTFVGADVCAVGGWEIFGGGCNTVHADSRLRGWVVTGAAAGHAYEVQVKFAYFMGSNKPNSYVFLSNFGCNVRDRYGDYGNPATYCWT